MQAYLHDLCRFNDGANVVCFEDRRTLLGDGVVTVSLHHCGRRLLTVPFPVAINLRTFMSTWAGRDAV